MIREVQMSGDDEYQYCPRRSDLPLVEGVVAVDVARDDVIGGGQVAIVSSDAHRIRKE